MVKRAVVRVAARGYVDGRYIGEDKELVDRGGDRRPAGRTKRGAKTKGGDDVGNKIAGPKGRGRKGAAGAARPGAAAPGRGRRTDRVVRGERTPRSAVPAVDRPRRGKAGVVGKNGGGRREGGAGRDGVRAAQGSFIPGLSTDGNIGNVAPIEGNRIPRGDVDGTRGVRTRKNRGGKKTPFRATQNHEQSLSISETAAARRLGDEAKSGQFAEALQRESIIKRERLHKVLAQSGHGSRRDMEILISSGRAMVNGIVATTGTSVSASDNVQIDHRPVKLKFNEDLPRVLLYHKPEGEIVSTDDPGNRITVFDNLPRVENGKWTAIGRLDVNTSGLLIFTTSGELANRMMHPRYEVEREYAVRVLGELTDEQTQALLTGVSIDGEHEAAEEWTPPTDDEYEFDEDGDAMPPIHVEPVPVNNLAARLARFDSIDERGGEGANHWYHVVLREGRNREVRKMFESQGLTVSRLIRVRFGKVTLPQRLPRGRMVELDPSQVRTVLHDAGIPVEGPMAKLEHAPRAPRPGGPRGAARENPNSVGDASPARPPREPRVPREQKTGQGKNRRSRGRRDPVVDGSASPPMVDGIPDFSGSAFDDASPSSTRGSPAVPGAANAERGANSPRQRRGRRGRGRDDRADRPPRSPQAPRAAGVNAGVGAPDDNLGNRVSSDGSSAPGPAAIPNAGAPGEGASKRRRGRRDFRRGRGKSREDGGSGGAGGGSEGGSGGPEPGNSL